MGAITKLVCHTNQAVNFHEFTLCAFIDYHKAFDSVNFDILISKRLDISVNYQIIDWFRNYFCYNLFVITGCGNHCFVYS